VTTTTPAPPPSINPPAPTPTAPVATAPTTPASIILSGPPPKPTPAPAPVPPPQNVAPTPATPAPETPVVATPAAPETAPASNTVVATTESNSTDAGYVWPLVIAGASIVLAIVIVLWLVMRSKRPQGSLITSSMRDDPRLPPRK
jgi:hypothetical protein